MNKKFVTKDGILVPSYVEHNLHGGVWAKYTLDVVSPDGELIDHKEGPCRSFLRNFGRFWRQMLSVPDTSPEQFDDDTGVGRLFGIFDTDTLGGNEGPIAAVAQFKVGNSATAVDSTQDNIVGTMLESPTDVVTVTVLEDGTQAQWTHTATITNTGASFTVREIGLFARLTRGDVLGENDRCMMLRDVVPDTVIPNGSSAVPRYTFTVAI